MEGLFLFASLAILFASSAMGMTMFIKPRWVANLIAPNRRRHLSKTIKEVGFILTFISLIAVVLVLHDFHCWLILTLVGVQVGYYLIFRT